MKIAFALMCGVSATVLASVAYAQPQPPSGQVESVVVTGSRVITNGNEAPTPVTVVSPAMLQESTPSRISDGLQALPQFSGNPGVQGNTSPTANTSGSYLNLRQFGVQRNLILLDGNRLAPTATTGAVDVNVIPQQFVQRVDIVTGGASAVYGSDAITGVVNFVLDHNFNGFKANAQAGVSNYGDGASWRFGAAWGMPLFGGRGHIEASYDYYKSQAVLIHDRPGGKDDLAVGGDGSPGNPFRIIQNTRVLTGAAGGLIVGSPPAQLRNIAFDQNGIPNALVVGGSTGLSGSQSGGDGGAYFGTLFQPLHNDQAFVAFDYDISDNFHAYIQSGYTDSISVSVYAPLLYQGAILSGDPYIPASIQQIMTATNTPFIQISRGFADSKDYPPRIANSYNTNLFIKAGATGNLFKAVDWKFNYTYDHSMLKVIHQNNGIMSHIAAAFDAVTDPATGKIVCNVSLTVNAYRYPGCVPFNPFGPTAPSKEAYSYITGDTAHTLTNLLHDAELSFSASPFSTWAGPVRMALSGEYRSQSLRDITNANPLTPMDCTGLRTAGTNCSPTTSPYVSAAVAPAFATQDVKEGAVEVLIPLLSNVHFANSLDLDLAGRYTDYSTSGAVETWKVGLSWAVNDELRLRAARSHDIRAPTLYDLFGPVSIGLSGYTDLHTNTTGVTKTQSGSNPALMPEMSNTSTVGLVYQPSWLPGFSSSFDYFDISMKNAITNVQGTSLTIQQQCISSNNTSPFCSLYVWPLGYANTTPANYPTLVKSQSLNIAQTSTNGLDAEVDYHFDLADVSADLPGSLTVRAIGTYQPQLRSQVIKTVRPVEQAGIAVQPGSAGFGSSVSKTRLNLYLGYDWEELKLSVTETFESAQHPSDPRISTDLRPTIGDYYKTDLSVSYHVDVDGNDLTPFLTIQNLFNVHPYMLGGSTSAPGLTYPSVVGQDAMGRYFTIGLRSRF